MKHDKVGSVMSGEVVRALFDTSYPEVVRLLARYRISGLPVVDEDDKVLGVISETDLLIHQPNADAPGRAPRFLWSSLPGRARVRESKAQARTAGQLMTHPAVTVRAEQSIAEAARSLAEHRVERLPVVDVEDRLVGIVTRRDLFQVFLRPDPEIRREVINEVLVRALWLEPDAVDVEVRDGVVTLTGRLGRRGEIPVALRMTRQIDGVVRVVDRLAYLLDDSPARPRSAERYPMGGLGLAGSSFRERDRGWSQ
ncbi:CBS domain-containing protein [Streptomyces sp. NPDC091376]|uniref:CBS domain-containing protein n=1 Tax=Streptomyces sp. NPDC091376 TaxID=3365994 RepID=UPI0038180F78